VRNAEADLPGWLASVRAFADAVVALDDGSTDGTRAVLDADPLVARLLVNPRRETYEGWDDAANRQRLLDAAGDLDPGWVLFLDSDERLDTGDGEALRAFIDGHAEPGFAYGFRVHRMTGDGAHYDRAGLWVYRLFAFEAGCRLPTRRLHLIPVPTSIPRDRWLRTTLRIQHFGASTDERRVARLEKYRAADPTEEFQSDYAQLTEPAVVSIQWEERPFDLPVLLDLPAGRGTGSIEVTDLGPLDGPVLSAIVIAREDEGRIEQALRSVVEQECPFEFEVIVVVSGNDRTAAIVRERFHGVRLIELDRPALPGEARNAGVAVARGDYVSFPGSHIELQPGSLAARLRAHELGYPMVTGVFDNGTRTPAGWASYFLDHSANLPTASSRELIGPPGHCSYDRELLLSAGPFPEDMRAGEDTAVNQALWKRGAVAYRCNEIRLMHNSPCSTTARLLKHHHTRGRALGRLLLQERRRVDAALWLATYLPRRMKTTTRNVRSNGDAEMQRRYRRAMPLVVAACISAWAGALMEVARTKGGDPR
jgi:glycosyltransferase involved in cell wall biosynthesis